MSLVLGPYNDGYHRYSTYKDLLDPGFTWYAIELGNWHPLTDKEVHSDPWL